MAEGATTTLKGLRAQYVAAAQAQAEERRSQSVNSPTTAEPPIIAKAPTKPVIDGSTLRTDERQRLAKERREEREKQIAARESQLVEKEKKARLQYEKQIEERQKKLEEQKLKEEQRRVAVEVKRKQKLEEEKERYEAVIRRTLERSQRVEQRQKRWSWGGALSTENENSSGVENSLSPPLNIADCSHPSSEFQTSTTEDVSGIDKRSASTMNLVKQTEPVINKRLSSSSAVLVKSPERSSSSKKRSSSLNRLGSKTPQPFHSPQKVTQVEQPARRSQNNPQESNVISRLLTPTQSSLARSKSAAALSEGGRNSPESHLCPRSASASSMNSLIIPPNKPLRSRSIDRQKVTSASQTEESKPIETAQKQVKEKRPSSPSSPATRTGRRRSPSPANLSKRPPSPSTTAAKRPPSPSTIKSNPKNRPPSPSTFKQRPPSPTNIQKPLPIQRLPLTPIGGSATKKKIEKERKPKQKNEVAGQEHGAVLTPEKEPSGAQSTKTKDSEQKTGTTTAEEAAKILAEKRRLAREQKEREEQEKLKREEAEKLRKEELVKKAAEERIRKKEEERKEEEERKVKEEENQRLAEDERIHREQEEQEHFAELQQQREEAEAKALEEAERQKLERERIVQQNLQERLERKKRIDEIMKRTRKGDLTESKMDDKSDNPDPEDEDEPENEDLDDEEGTNGIRAFQDDSQLECGFKTVPTDLSTQPTVDEITDLNGLDKPNNIVNSLDGDQPMDVSPMPKEESISECLHLNEADQSVGLESQNGKSSAWIFEEFIGVHSKNTKLTVAARDADDCNQNLIDAGGIPENRIIALEENRGVTSLTKPLEATSEL